MSKALNTDDKSVKMFVDVAGRYLVFVEQPTAELVVRLRVEAVLFAELHSRALQLPEMEPDEVDDEGVRSLARTIAEHISQDFTFPGEIKVTVIRELRADAVAG